jgi:hypothetical protein
VAQEFAARHAWYVSGEAKSIAAWRQLSGAAAAGVISDEDFGTRLGREVLPFWKEAAPRLEAEVSSLSGEQQGYVRTLSHLASLRTEWAEAVVSASTGRDREKAEIARRKDAEAQTEIARLERLAARSNAARMTGGLVNLPLVQKLRSHLRSGKDRCVEVPAAYRTGFAVAATDLATDSPATLKRIGCEAQAVFLGADFRTLDAMFARAAATVGDLPTGASTLSGLIGGLSDLIYYSEGGNIEQYLRQIGMWRRAVPDSYYPDLLEIELYQLWAWSVRGHGTSNQVTQQAWALFAFRNEIAQVSLDDTSSRAQRDPLWCHLAMRLQHDRANDLEPIMRMYRTCIGQFPKFIDLHANMLRSLMPRWYGSAQQVTEFIETTAAAEPEERRDAMYAQLYWIYANLERDEVNIFDESGADWSRVDRGFESLEELYPKSDLVLNAHARFACLAQDDIIYRVLRSRLTGRRSATAWTNKTTEAGCNATERLWNTSMSPRQGGSG